MAVSHNRARWGAGPAACHSSVSALPPALVWWYGSASTTISSIGSRRVPRHLTPFGIRVGWRVALMGSVVRGSSTMRTTWRTGWMTEPFGVDPDVSLSTA
jgi:hypothetical protein